MLKPNTDDIKHWTKLAKKHLSHNNLPKWDKDLSVGEMDRWADRLGMTEKDYIRHTKTSFREFINLNPEWGMLAWVGTCLEIG